MNTSATSGEMSTDLTVDLIKRVLNHPNLYFSYGYCKYLSDQHPLHDNREAYLNWILTKPDKGKFFFEMNERFKSDPNYEVEACRTFLKNIQAHLTYLETVVETPENKHRSRIDELMAEESDEEIELEEPTSPIEEPVPEDGDDNGSEVQLTKPKKRKKKVQPIIVSEADTEEQSEPAVDEPEKSEESVVEEPEPVVEVKPKKKRKSKKKAEETPEESSETVEAEVKPKKKRKSKKVKETEEETEEKPSVEAEKPKKRKSKSKKK